LIKLSESYKEKEREKQEKEIQENLLKKSEQQNKSLNAQN